MNEFFNRLNMIMMTVFTCLSVKRNQVLVRRREVNLGYALLQYCLFPKHIVSMLATARDVAQAQGWSDIVHELNRNIGQERGSDSKNIPHYALLDRAMKREFGLVPWETVERAATGQFILLVLDTLRSNDPFVVMGAVYALECTAVPELTVVLDLVEFLASKRENKRLHSDTLWFFERHLGTWEPSHEEGLRTAIGALLSGASEEERFEQGFHRVLQTMETWWAALAEEAASQL